MKYTEQYVGAFTPDQRKNDGMQGILDHGCARWRTTRQTSTTPASAVPGSSRTYIPLQPAAE